MGLIEGTGSDAGKEAGMEDVHLTDHQFHATSDAWTIDQLEAVLRGDIDLYLSHAWNGILSILCYYANLLGGYRVPSARR